MMEFAFSSKHSLERGKWAGELKVDTDVIVNMGSFVPAHSRCSVPWGLFCLLGGKGVGLLLSLGLCEFWFLLGKNGARQPLVEGRSLCQTLQGAGGGSLALQGKFMNIQPWPHSLHPD